MTEETLENSDLDSLTFVASARIAKHQAKQRQPKKATVPLTPHVMQQKPKLKKGYYEVEKILDHKITSRGKKEYLVKWAYYGHESNSWERAENLDGSPDALNEYWQTVAVYCSV
jgi:hypothetical protein